MARRPAGKLSPYSLLGALGLALFAGMSALLFTRELDQYQRGILNDVEGFEHWLAPDHALPLSINGQVELLTGCVFALESWKTQFQSSRDVNQVAQNCAAEARRILGFNNKLSEAHYLLAYTANLESDASRAIAHLADAQANAPSDQWLAVRRVNLAQAILPGEPQIQGYDLQSDLGLLIASEQGLSTATRLYIRYPQLRDMIVDSTAELSDQDRVRFLNTLRRQVNR